MYRIPINDEIIHVHDIEGYSCVKIARSNELVNDLEKQLKKTQKLLELAKADRIETIKNEVQYFEEIVYSNYIDKYITAKSKGEKVRKNSEISKSFIIAQNYFREMLQNDKIEITDFMTEGYEGYKNLIEFVIGNHKFELGIPVLEKCTQRNLEYVNDGKLTVYYCEKPSVWSMKCSSYDEKELAEEFNKFLDKLNKE